MLRSLSGKCEGHLVEAAVEKFVEGVGKATFECRRRAHARTQRHVALIDGIEALHFHAMLHQLTHYTIDIAEMNHRGALGIVYGKFTALAEVYSP